MSLGIHALLIVAALSFVAVAVSQKEHVTFEAMQPNRSKLPLRKLQVPVNMKKTQAPKLRKTIVAKGKIAQVDSTMPEIKGVKGEMGFGAGGGLRSLVFDFDKQRNDEFYLGTNRLVNNLAVRHRDGFFECV